MKTGLYASLSSEHQAQEGTIQSQLEAAGQPEITKAMLGVTYRADINE